MNKNQVLKELEKIDSEYQAELKEQHERYSRLRELFYNIPDLERKYKNNDFSPEEAKIVDEYESLIFGNLDAWDRKQKKIREFNKTMKENIKTHRSENIQVETTAIGREIINSENEKKLYKKLNDENDENEKGMLPVVTKAAKGKQKEVITSVSISFNQEELKKSGIDIPSLGRLNAFDKEILTACISLYNAGNKIFSCDMLFRQLGGGEKLREKMRAAIYNSLRKMRIMTIRIFANNEVDKGLNKKRIFEGALLPNSILYDEITYLNGKEVKDCIKILDNSPLYEYGQAKGQIGNFPRELIEIPSINSTPENIVLKMYIARRIVDMWNRKSNASNFILYDTIFNYLEIEAENATTLKIKKSRIRATVRKILEVWKERGYIEDFEELGDDNKPVSNGKNIAKIKITLRQLQKMLK